MLDRGLKVDEAREKAQGWLSVILPHVLANAAPGSPLQQAAETFAEQQNREDGPTSGAAHLFAEAWHGTGREEQTRVLNGWRPCNEWPKQADVLAMFDHGIDPVLRVEVDSDGGLVMTREFVPSCGAIAPLILSVRCGADTPTILMSLQAIREAFEAHLAAAIALEPRAHISVPPPAERTATDSTASALESVSRQLEELRSMLRGPAKADEGPGVESMFAATAEGREFRHRLIRAMGMEPENGWSADEIVEYVKELRWWMDRMLAQWNDPETRKKDLRRLRRLATKKPHSGSVHAPKLGGKEQKPTTKAAN